MEEVKGGGVAFEVFILVSNKLVPTLDIWCPTDSWLKPFPPPSLCPSFGVGTVGKNYGHGVLVQLSQTRAKDIKRCQKISKDSIFWSGKKEEIVTSITLCQKLIEWFWITMLSNVPIDALVEVCATEDELTIRTEIVTLTKGNITPDASEAGNMIQLIDRREPYDQVIWWWNCLITSGTLCYRPAQKENWKIS